MSLLSNHIPVSNRTSKLKKIAIVSFVALSISGCSIFNFGGNRTNLPPQTKSANNPCLFDKSRCMYDGNYEAGERQYAEDEARRLNQAQLERLRRGF